MITLNWFYLILILGAVQGVILSIGLLKLKNGNQDANKLLALFLVLVSLTLLGRVSYAGPVNFWLPQLSLIPDLILFLYGPIFYFYLQNLFQ